MLDFTLSVSLDGEALTDAEIEQVLASSSGLHFIRGRWVEIDRARLRQMLDEFRAVEAAARTNGLTFTEAVRLLAGANVPGDRVSSETPDWSAVVAGPWLSNTLAELRDPDQLATVDPGDELKTTLRPYQRTGVQWLHKLSTLGLGACLADDMGLGKTMQVLALLLVVRRRAARDDRRRASILVAPASLLANWSAEIARFAPGLTAMIAHPSAMTATDLQAIDRERVGSVDLVITSYGTLLRAPRLAAIPWRLAILDEAQAVKTPGSKQTRAVKQLEATARIALTGTPVENRLGDLWSIFDVVNPGLLGSPKAFSAFTKRLSAAPHNPYGPLRSLVRPYILRRLKTDRSVIDDLPDKTEVKAYCSLTRKQASLYQQAVAVLRRDLQQADGMKRRGVVQLLLRLHGLRVGCGAPAAGRARTGEADQERAQDITGHHRRTQDRHDLLGQGVVRQPRTLQRLRESAAARTVVCAQRHCRRSATAGTKVLAEEDLSAMFGIEIATPAGKAAGPVAKPLATPARSKSAVIPKSASVRIPKSTSAAARIRATKSRSPLALKRAIAKQLRDRRAGLQRSKKP